MIEHVLFKNHSSMMAYCTSGLVDPYKILYGGIAQYLPQQYSRYSTMIPEGGAVVLKIPV